MQVGTGSLLTFKNLINAFTLNVEATARHKVPALSTSTASDEMH